VGNNLTRVIPCQKLWGTISRGKYLARISREQFPAGNSLKGKKSGNFLQKIPSQKKFGVFNQEKWLKGSPWACFRDGKLLETFLFGVVVISRFPQRICLN